VAEGFAVYRPVLDQYTKLIRRQADAIADVHQGLAAIDVPAGAFGKLTESGALDAAYHQHAAAELANTRQMPGLLDNVAKGLTRTADRYEELDAAQARAIRRMFGQATAYTGSEGAPAVSRRTMNVTKGMIDSAWQAYSWTEDPAAALPEVDPLQKGSGAGIGGAIDSAVMWVLEKTGLLGMLDMVTGDPDAVHQAALAWREQGVATQQAAAALRHRARDLPEHWQGAGSEAFGKFMRTLVAALEAMASDMGQTGQILSEAGQQCQFAQDFIVMIIQQVIEWVLGSIALDAVTLGLSTVVDGLLDSARMAQATIEVGGEVSRLERVLAKLIGLLQDIQEADTAFKEAEGFEKFKTFLGLGAKLEDSLAGISDLKYVEDSKMGGVLAKALGAGEHAANGRSLEEIEEIRQLGQGGVLAEVGLKLGVKGLLVAPGLPDDVTELGLAKSIGAQGLIEALQHKQVVRADLDQLLGENPATGRGAYHLPVSEIDAILNPGTGRNPEGSSAG
jgi:uncharacterized protein YukE